MDLDLSIFEFRIVCVGMMMMMMMMMVWTIIAWNHIVGIVVVPVGMHYLNSQLERKRWDIEVKVLRETTSKSTLIYKYTKPKQI